MGDVGDGTCQLECLKGPRVREFVGPVKIVLVDPTPADYARRAWSSAFIAFANLLLGATVFTILYFSLIFKLPFYLNAHVCSCTIGFQLLLPSAIMMVNPLFGGAAQLKSFNRVTQHIYIHTFTVICAVGGSVLVLLFMPRLAVNVHTITGTLAAFLTLGNAGVGPFVICIFRRRGAYATLVKTIHRAIGMAAFVLSSVTLCSGILRPSFIKWGKTTLLPELPYLLYIFCTLYTLILIVSVYWKGKIEVK